MDYAELKRKISKLREMDCTVAVNPTIRSIAPREAMESSVTVAREGRSLIHKALAQIRGDKPARLYNEEIKQEHREINKNSSDLLEMIKARNDT